MGCFGARGFDRQFCLRRLCPRPISIRQPSCFMRRQPQGHSIPTDLNIGMMVPLFCQPSNSLDPIHGSVEIRKNLGSDQTRAVAGPCRLLGLLGWLGVADRFHQPRTVGTPSSGSSFPLRKFFAALWEQRSKGVLTGTQQSLFQRSARVVPKTIHIEKFLIPPCLTGFPLVVRFVHRPY